MEGWWISLYLSELRTCGDIYAPQFLSVHALINHLAMFPCQRYGLPCGSNLARHVWLYLGTRFIPGWLCLWFITVLSWYHWSSFLSEREISLICFLSAAVAFIYNPQHCPFLCYHGLSHHAAFKYFFLGDILQYCSIDANYVSCCCA